MKKNIFFAGVVILLALFISCSSKKEMVKAPTLSNDYALEIAHHREKYKEDFIENERSPLKEQDLDLLNFFPPDESYACNCDFTSTANAKIFEMATYSGKTKPFQKYGIATCKLNGKELTVNIYSSIRVQAMPGYENYLFIPFKDITSGESTYGGGRYIDIVKGDIVDNKVLLDFNKCYNPWCAYSDGYNCPIPPVENHFDLAILAGEKMWSGEKKH